MQEYCRSVTRKTGVKLSFIHYPKPQTPNLVKDAGLIPTCTDRKK